MALTKVTGQVIKNTTDVTVGVLTVTNTLAVGGTVSIGGTLTYEDVTNVDAVGLITARDGIVVGSGITLSKDGDIIATTGTFSDDITITGGSGRLTVSSSVDSVGIFTSTDSNATLDLFDNDTQTRFRTVDGFFNISADHRNAVAGSEIRFLVDGTNQIAIDENGHLLFKNDTDTYIHRPQANTLAFITADNERFRVTSAGNVGIGTTMDSSGTRRLHVYRGSCGAHGQAAGEAVVESNNGATFQLLSPSNTTNSIFFGDNDSGNVGRIAYNHNNDEMIFKTNGNNNHVTIDSSGRVLIGDIDARSPQNITTQLQIEGIDANTSSMSLTRNSNSVNGPDFIFNKTRGSSLGGDVVVQDGDFLGNLTWVGNDGTDSNNAAARISCQVDGTPGSNDMPGRLTFHTTPDGSTTPEERLRITSSGSLLINHTTARYDDLLQIEGTGGESTIAVIRNSNNGSGAGLMLGKSRTNSVGGNTIVQDGDKLGVISFTGADGTDLASLGAQISGEVDGTPGENDMPGRLVFKTTSDSNASSTERVRIDSGGRMGVGLTPITGNVATNISPGLIQTDGNIDLRYSGTNNDPAGARYVNFINTDTTLVAGQPLGGLHWIGNDSENPNTINAAILVDCAGNAGAQAHLLFQTSGTQRIRIKNNGDLVSSSGSTSRIAFGSGDGTLYSGMGYYAGGNQDVGLSLYATTNAGVQFVEHFRMEHNGTLKATDTSIGSLSDSRLKKDIADYSYDISKFKQFKPKSFNWINPEVHGDKSNVKGFIAQDIELVDKDWVEDSWISEDDPDFALISDTTDVNGAGETVGVSKMSKFGYKDAMYISVIQQLIDRIETLEKAN